MHAMRNVAVLAVLTCCVSVLSVAAQGVQQAKLPILVYHHVRETKGYPKSTWSYKMSVSPKVFEQQMQWLKDKGYTTVSMDDAAAILAGTKTGPSKPVVITFDDNNLSAYDVALPLLQKYGHIATYYLVTNKLKNPNFIDAERAKDLAAKGMDIQSHTVTHATLTALGQKKLDAELADSRVQLEALIGKPVMHIAYPSTAHNKTVRERTKNAGYATGTIMDPRWATGKDDPFKLPRIMMTDDTKLEKVLP